MMKLTGSCHCGAITFAVDGEPVRMAQCHCNACRRITGTGHNVQAFFKRDDVNISGNTRTHQSTSDSGNIRTRHFCPECGSRLFSENSATPGGIGIAAGSFDDSSWFQPQAILYISERPKWDTMDENIRSFEKMPPA